MNRCLLSGRASPVLKGLLVAATLAFALPVATAQWQDPQRIPPITTGAMRGTLKISSPPEVLLDGKPARLAPGARIRDRNNLLVVSGALLGQTLPIRYTRDSLGLLREIWVLTPKEAAVGQPEPVQLPPY